MSDIKKLENYKSLLVIACEAIKYRALEAKKLKDTKNDLFNLGRLLGFNEVISIIIQEASPLGVELKEIDLDGINPDKDLT
jgi:hypothetical protein